MISSLKNLANRYPGVPAVVMGTGPSAWPVATQSAFRSIANKAVVIGINRAPLVLDIPADYQLSVDRIWLALISKPEAKVNHVWLLRYYERWLAERQLRDWSIEDFVAAYQTDLNLHYDVLNYYKLASMHAPFRRLIMSAHSPGCPYPHITFDRARQTPVFGEIRDGLTVEGNSGHAAIHLAGAMGCDPIILIGIDMTPADPSIRPWEKGAAYHVPSVAKGFDTIRKAFAGRTHIWNANPLARLSQFPRVKLEDAIQKIRQAPKSKA